MSLLTLKMHHLSFQTSGVFLPIATEISKRGNFTQSVSAYESNCNAPVLGGNWAA